MYKCMSAENTPSHDWLCKVIRKYRDRLGAMDQEAKRCRVSNLSDFSNPSEVVWIRFRDPVLQTLILTQPEDIETDQIHIYDGGPFQAAVDRLEDILQDVPFQRTLSRRELLHYLVKEDEQVKLRSFVESHLVGLVDNPPSYWVAAQYDKEGYVIQSMSILTDHGFIWTVLGDLSRSEVDGFVDSLLPERPAESPAPQSSNSQDDPFVPGYCAYFYPPVWIEDKDVPLTLRSKTRLGIAQRADSVVLVEQYRNYMLLVKTGGLIAINARSREEAHVLFNEIMAGAFFGGISAHVLHLSEVGDIKIDLSAKTTGMMQLTLVSPRQDQVDEFFRSFRSTSRDRQLIEPEQMRMVIQRAERISRILPQQWISWFLQGHTHFENLEFDQAFITLWTILEQKTTSEWNNRVSSLSKKRKNKYRMPGYWSVDRSLEVLNLHGLIPDEDYSIISNFKKTRNSIVHELRSIGHHEARSILDYVERVLERIIAEDVALRKH